MIFETFYKIICLLNKICCCDSDKFVQLIEAYLGLGYLYQSDYHVVVKGFQFFDTIFMNFLFQINLF